MEQFILTHKGLGFAAISIVAKDVDGNPVTPDSDPLCEIYRMDPDTGLLAKDLLMGTNGEINLSLVGGFLYSGSLDLSPALFSFYECVVTYSYGGSAGTNVVHVQLVISGPDTVIYNNRNVVVASQATTFVAPTPIV